ncbi:MAG: hypothetical protein GY796_23930 [Chloroflexi bacterium]|nr:hypothetical protein [Chloroflexota bacterium]
MAEQINISIPHTLYRRVRELARMQQRPVDDVLDTAVTLAEAAQIPAAGEETAMTQEEAAYRIMHNELMVRYAGEYVAIYQGQLIDHDQDELALLRRLDAQYPNEVVLMKQVRPLPEPELRFRSPRLVRNGS